MEAEVVDSMSVAMVGMLPPPVGGVARTCQSLATELTGQGVKVVFIDVIPHPDKRRHDFLTAYHCFRPVRPASLVELGAALLGWSDPCLGRRLRRAAGELLRTPGLRRRPRYLIALLHRVYEMAVWLRKEPVQVVHGHHAGIYSFAALLVARHWLDCPFVVTVYVSEFTMSANRPWLPVAQRVCEEADAVVCISAYTRQTMLASGATATRVHVLPPGCEPRHFRSVVSSRLEVVRSRFDLSSDRPVILFVGHLIPRKGPQTLIAALGRLRDLAWQAVLAGPDFGFGRRLQQKAAALEIIQRVRFPGVVAEDDLTALYELGDVFVFPTISADEGFGLVALEAMAHGTPVVGSRKGAIPELVRDGETGFLFTPGNDKELSTHLRTLLRAPALCSRLGQQARDRARRYTWPSVTRQLHRLYRDARASR